MNLKFTTLSNYFFKKITLFLIIIIAYSNHAFAQWFEQQQLQFSRVIQAQNDSEGALMRAFAAKNLSYPPSQVFFRAFKKEGILEVWVKSYNNPTFIKLKEYTVCASSGNLGPKRRQGDMQVPEGFYYINKFNPESSFYLSLGINYPNSADLMHSGGSSAGGDIYIHGDCVTIGCLPLTNPEIKEVYWLAVKARNNGQEQIPVHIFPFKFLNATFEAQERNKNAYNSTLLSFWDNLKQGYNYFEYGRQIPNVSISADGSYIFW